METSPKQISQSVRSLRQNLKRVPGGHLHDAGNINDEIIRNILMEQVTHAVDENHARPGPAQWLVQFFGYQSKIEALLIRMTGHATKSFCKGLGVTMSTSRTDLRATTD